MTMQNSQVVILRDTEGTFYLLAPAVLEAGRVPADKQQALQAALSGEVSGYLFSLSFPSQVANLGVTTLFGGFASGTCQVEPIGMQVVGGHDVPIPGFTS
jgi:hypothetical protein